MHNRNNNILTHNNFDVRLIATKIRNKITFRRDVFDDLI